ncbi:uncharacterized protein LOC117318404 [Pecten maximus]|uniref:uncharacterized protein LOC117318404 n=1 Tax=Pecten maximus TaxID=6579 RepID=UPI0014588F25|nr:uncharacterized protein LOC117318404 [Pecten maximus]
MAGAYTIVTFYHHTSLEGMKLIAQSGYIKKSTDVTTDAKCGPGVYLTNLSASCPVPVVLSNNYGSAGTHMMDRAEATVALDLPNNMVTTCLLGERVVYTVPEDILLKDINHRFYVRCEDGTPKRVYL